ncbi:MAG: hypothetical protein U1E53_24210 [Dongiaceae bacterium]
MRIGIVSAAVPLAGGGRRIAAALRAALTERNHRVETVLLPIDESADDLLQQVMAYRLVELDPQFDRVITVRPPAHVVRHRCKVVLIGHRTRSSLPDTRWAQALRAELERVDAAALREARAVYVRDRETAERLRRGHARCEALALPLTRARRAIGWDAALEKLLA